MGASVLRKSAPRGTGNDKIFTNPFIIRTLLFWCGQLTRVVRKADNAIQRINHCPVDSVVCFVNSCPLDSDLSGG